MPGKQRLKSARGAVLAGAVSLVLAGCATTNPGLVEPVLTPVTVQNQSLRTLPPPRERVPVAVYDFPDLTGQYKERENVQTLSRAVSQGGAPMLIKALQDAGERKWFSVLDRSRLDDILRERQIVTEMRRIYRGEQQVPASVLPPLSHAGVILQGGITGFDTNTMTGGVGARYLGIGGDAKWRQHTVTISLRAVSTNTAEVLASVTSHKAIASYALQGGAFRYVALDRILEAEAGITQNEPKHIAVQQAIEKAVVALIIEGAELGIWSFQDPEKGRQVIADYRNEKYGTRITDAARIATPPATPDPARVVQTEPAPPRVAAAPRVQRAPQPQPEQPARPPAQPEQPPAPATPPPGDENEVLGSTREPAPDPASAATPPPPSANEVVGSAEPTDDSAPSEEARSDSPRQMASFSPNNDPQRHFTFD